LPRENLIPAFPVFDGAALEQLREVNEVRGLLSGLKRVLANATECSLRCKDHRRRFRLHFRSSGKNRASSQGVLKIKGENSEYRYLNVSLVIGGSVTAFQLYVRRSRSAGETSTASQPFAPG
jgi:hypothetical protein